MRYRALLAFAVKFSGAGFLFKINRNAHFEYIKINHHESRTIMSSLVVMPRDKETTNG